MKNILIITLGIIIILITHYLGHILPLSIFCIPLLIIIITGLLFFLTDFHLAIKFGLLMGMMILNDVLLKYYPGDDHDWEGVDWIVIFEFIGLIISIIVIIISGFISRKKNIKKYFLFIVASCCLFFIYQSYFNSLGMVWINDPISNLRIAKQKGLYISDVKFSDSIIINDNDTFRISQGWIEQQTETNHMGLFKKTHNTDKIYCTIIIKKIGDFELDPEIWYQLNESDSLAFNPISPIINLTLNKTDKYCRMVFYDKVNFKKI